ncbi:MAG: hypothetical protein JWN31_602 [Frankiales bacterium]|nr:hypothetical protein [Frankiales bacterium]
MTLAQFVTGWALLLVWVGAPALPAVLIRRRLLPGWTGAPALLVDVLSTVALLLTVAQLVGVHGGLTRAGLTAGTLVVGSAGALVALRLPVGPRVVPARPAEPLWSRALGVIAVASVVGVWVSKTQQVLSAGNYDSDSLSYHWPYAAFFAQTGWTTQIHLGPPGRGSSWHAANGELLDAVTMLAFHRDWLLPLLNLGWLALALLAARCVGRRVGAAGLATAVACVLFALPILARSQGGSGFTDTASLALVLAGVVLFLEAFDDGPSPQVLLFCGVAFGLAVSTKETTLAVTAALAVAVLVLCGRAGRIRAFVVWAAPVLVLGSFWYLRNWAREGNPIPTSSLGPFPSIAGSFIDRYDYAVGHFLGNRFVLRHVFVPGLAVAWAVLWPALVVGVLVAVVLVLRRQVPGQLRALAVVGAVGLLGYVLTPTTAFGTADRPVLFTENTRYALPAMAVLLMLHVRAVRPGRERTVLGAAVLVVLVGTLVPRGSLPAVLPGHGERAAVVAAIALVVPVLGSVVQPRWRVAAVVLLVLPGLLVVGRGYERDRYRSAEGAAFAWADQVHGAHLGLSGVMQAYPFVGTDLSNRLDHIGLRNADRVFVVPPTCADWRRAVDRGGYGYVVLGPAYLPGEPRFADSWLDASAMTKVLDAPPYRVYRVVSRPDPGTCR